MEEYGFMKRLALLTLFCSLATGVIAAPNDGWNEGMILFKKGDTTNTNYYRIPAITTTSQGTMIIDTMDMVILD